jgi:hypothetical protein
MSSINIAGDTSGSVILTVPAAAGSSTITLPAGTGTVAVQGVSTNIVSGTAVASTSGTAIDFTGIPSWVKRITVMFYGVSTSGTTGFQVRVGTSSGVVATGYLGQGDIQSGSVNGNLSTGFTIVPDTAVSAAALIHGRAEIVNITGNTWICVSQTGRSDATGTGSSFYCSGSIPLSGVLDRVRINSGNGTDTFDAGSINIMYE